MNKEDEIMSGAREVFNKMASLNKSKMEVSLKGYKSSEVHGVEYIGKMADPNVTKLAEAFYMTRGAISKLTKKLMEKGLIESYQKAENKKEIYFRLTPKGQEVFDIHETLHQEFQARDKAVFDQITEEQFHATLNFLKNYSNHLDAEIQKQNTDDKI